jgi:hypothetical protein
MSDPKHQHEEVHDGLVKLQEYAVRYKQRVEEYIWSDMKEIIDDFAPSFIKHLTEEIDVVLGLEKSCDGEGLRKL